MANCAGSLAYLIAVAQENPLRDAGRLVFTALNARLSVET